MTGRDALHRPTRARAVLAATVGAIVLASGLGLAQASPATGQEQVTVDVELIRSDSRSAALRITCSALASIDVRAEMHQRGHVILAGRKTRKCNGTEGTTVVMTPITSFDGGRIEPIRRLLAGPARIDVSVRVDPPGSPPAEVVSKDRFPVVIGEPGLTRGRGSSHPGFTLEPAKVELAADGRLEVPVRLRCSRSRTLPNVTVTAYQDAPGGVYRWQRSSQTAVPCGEQRLVRFEMGAASGEATLTDIFGSIDPKWILGAGPIEVVAVAQIDDRRSPLVSMRPDDLAGESLPGLIRPVADPDSTVRLGAVTRGGARMSIRCPASVDQVVTAQWGHRRGMRVRSGAGFLVRPCRQDRVLAFEPRWFRDGGSRPPRGEVVAVHVASLGGPLDLLTPSWDVDQAGWRRVR